MTHAFDKEYWETHWREAASPDGHATPENPYLATETGGLVAGTAIDAGCGEGAEAIWLARHGWKVTAADISAAALDRASARATTLGVDDDLIEWVEADLSVWRPGETFDLVVTCYAHPAIPQLAFYERIAEWVAAGGTLLIVGHLHDHGHDGHGHHPEEATATAAGITSLLDPAAWDVLTADQPIRTVSARSGHRVELRDVVVTARRHH